MKLRIGSLFTGYAGLDLAVSEVLGAETVWFSEFDPAPSKILAHHWPNIPNHGDITLIDWSAVEPVDILTGGFPCQDVSLAGARAGLREGTRSGLWSYFAAAIDALRPELVVIENVRGLLSAKAGEIEEWTDEDDALDKLVGRRANLFGETPSGLESDTDVVGEPERGGRPVLRALGAVLGNLAELGYDAEWCGLRAADAGAPHGRYRIFILAHPQGRGRGMGSAENVWAPTGNVNAFGDEDPLHGPRSSGDRSATENADLAIGGERWQPTPRQTETGRSRAGAGRRGGAPTADSSGDESERWGAVRYLGGTSDSDESASEERQRVRDTTSDRGSEDGFAPDADNPGRSKHGGGHHSSTETASRSTRS